MGWGSARTSGFYGEVCESLGVSVGDTSLTPWRPAVLSSKCSSLSLTFVLGHFKNTALWFVPSLSFGLVVRALPPICPLPANPESESGQTLHGKSLHHLSPWNCPELLRPVRRGAQCGVRSQQKPLVPWALTSEDSWIADLPHVIETGISIQHVFVSSCLFTEWFQLQ